MTAPAPAEGTGARTAKHSRGPWRIHPVDDTVVIDADGREVAAIDGDYNNPDEWPIMEANAAFIVRTVNSHDALVDALRLLLADIEQYEAWQRPCHAVDVARAALAQAEGGDDDGR